MNWPEVCHIPIHTGPASPMSQSGEMPIKVHTCIQPWSLIGYQTQYLADHWLLSPVRSGHKWSHQGGMWWNHGRFPAVVYILDILASRFPAVAGNHEFLWAMQGARSKAGHRHPWSQLSLGVQGDQVHPPHHRPYSQSANSPLSFQYWWYSETCFSIK